MRKDYISYWREKGEYGEIRIKRMLERKKKKREKWVRKDHVCSCCGKKFDEVVPVCLDPFEFEMNHRKFYRRLCNYCYNDLLMDV